MFKRTEAHQIFSEVFKATLCQYCAAKNDPFQLFNILHESISFHTLLPLF
jgi:hypothetical protein